MIDMHPDHAPSHIALRQEIVKRGMDAARQPGDLAAIRERIGQMLITAGERVRGGQGRPVLTRIPDRRMTQPAR